MLEALPLSLPLATTPLGSRKIKHINHINTFASMVLTIHHLRLSQSERIIWLCEELEIPYELKCYERDPETKMAPAEYKALSPLGTSPFLQDGDVVLGESGACIEYIIARHGGGRLLPKPTDANYVDFIFWWHFADGSLAPAMNFDMLLSGVPDDYPFKGFAKQRMHTALKLMDDRLAKSKFLAGDDFTAAEIAVLFWFTTRNVFIKMDLSQWPHLSRYAQEVASRPAYVRAMEKGDPGLKLSVGSKPTL